MDSRPEIDEVAEPSFVSTGRLPPALAQALVDEAYQRCRSNTDGTNSRVYPALGRVRSDLFGICVAGTNGTAYVVGDADVEFTIMSVAKPFVFALVCQALGAEEARRKLGVNATGLPFNSLAAIEQSRDGTNPMVNPGAIAAASLASGRTVEEKWLDDAGNSVKGQLVAAFLSQRLGLDLFASKPEP